MRFDKFALAAEWRAAARLLERLYASTRNSDALDGKHYCGVIGTIVTA